MLLAIHQDRPLRQACYSSGKKWLLPLSAALILAGALLLIFCVPLWAYLALIGLILIALGILLLYR